jgi:hypothetical protein
MLAGGVALFLVIRWFGEALEAPPADKPAARAASHGGHVDVVLHVLAT